MSIEVKESIRVADALDHWQWRPEWTARRPCYYWYLTLGDAQLALDEVAATVDDCPWLDTVPEDWSHLTLCDVGFQDELSSEVLDQLAEAVGEKASQFTQFGLELGPLGMAPSALVLQAGPLEALATLRDLVLSTTREVLGPDPRLVHVHQFVPHVSVGYVNRRVSGHEVGRFLAGLPDLRRSRTVERLEMVCVTRQDRRYSWWHRRTVPLGRGRRRSGTSELLAEPGRKLGPATNLP